MSTISQFFSGGNRAPIAIVNAFSSGTPAGVSIVRQNALEILSGAVTSGVLKTVLSHTGAGCLKNLYVYTKDGTARTLRLKITLDGTSVFDSTSASISANGNGIVAVGPVQDTAGDRVFYNASLLVEIASSLSETDKIAIGVVRETYS